MGDEPDRLTETARAAPRSRPSVLGSGATTSPAGASPSPLRWLLLVVPVLVIVGGGYVLVARVLERLGASLPSEQGARTQPPPLAVAPPPIARLPSTRPSDRLDPPQTDPRPTPAPEPPFSSRRVIAALATADPDAGAHTFRICLACHNAAPGAQAKIGSNLWNIVGSRKARDRGYAYSDALRAKGGLWSFEDLAAYLHDPRAFVPGGKMALAGIKDERRIADLLAHLRRLADNPVPLPAALRP